MTTKNNPNEQKEFSEQRTLLFRNCLSALLKSDVLTIDQLYGICSLIDLYFDVPPVSTANWDKKDWLVYYVHNGFLF